jgi:hypothetical protein
MNWESDEKQGSMISISAGDLDWQLLKARMCSLVYAPAILWVNEIRSTALVAYFTQFRRTMAIKSVLIASLQPLASNSSLFAAAWSNKNTVYFACGFAEVCKFADGAAIVPAWKACHVQVEYAKLGRHGFGELRFRCLRLLGSNLHAYVIGCCSAAVVAYLYSPLG